MSSSSIITCLSQQTIRVWCRFHEDERPPWWLFAWMLSQDSSVFVSSTRMSNWMLCEQVIQLIIVRFVQGSPLNYRHLNLALFCFLVDQVTWLNKCYSVNFPRYKSTSLEHNITFSQHFHYSNYFSAPTRTILCSGRHKIRSSFSERAHFPPG